jgi:hypothetical protein
LARQIHVWLDACGLRSGELRFCKCKVGIFLEQFGNHCRKRTPYIYTSGASFAPFFSPRFTKSMPDLIKASSTGVIDEPVISVK